MEKHFLVFVVLLFASLLQFTIAEIDEDSKKDQKEDIPPEKVEYLKGSVCGYCEYCKFCKLCDEQCPCESGPKRPNCHMCKYCKYCYLCSGICNTICQPGGIVDKVSSAIMNTLASDVSKEEVDKEIAGVKTWIDKKKEEL